LVYYSQGLIHKYLKRKRLRSRSEQEIGTVKIRNTLAKCRANTIL